MGAERPPRVLPREPWRSLRVRAVVVVVIVVLLPLALVASSSWFERNVGARMQSRLVSAAAGVEAVLLSSAADGANADDLGRRLDDVAKAWGSRVRVADEGGTVLFDVDREATAISRLGAIFFGVDGAPALRDVDDEWGALHARAEVRAAEQKPQVGCRATEGAKLLVCHAARVVEAPGGQRWIVYVQESSRRSIRALYDLRYQLLKLTLLILPAALLLAWWLGWRMIRPVERLREQVLDKVTRAAPEADLELTRGDELGELALAFNTLLTKLDEKGRATEAFLADLAHELKNPVAAVRASAESLESGAVDDERARRLSKVLSDSSRRLDALVTQLLELARAEAGLEGEEREVVDVSALICGVVEHTAADVRYADVRFSLDVTNGARVRGVSHRLESAVRNLVDNAASFAGSEGEVTVRVGVTAGHVVVDVRDSGPGIAPEHLPRVFERFFTTRGTRRGTGLGLALVRAVVTAHGGAAEVESAPGQGALFRLRLPAA